MWDLEIFPRPPRALRGESRSHHLALLHLIFPTLLFLLLLPRRLRCLLVDFRQRKEQLELRGQRGQ